MPSTIFRCTGSPSLVIVAIVIATVSAIVLSLLVSRLVPTTAVENAKKTVNLL
jgi:hypothetical protein